MTRKQWYKGWSNFRACARSGDDDWTGPKVFLQVQSSTWCGGSSLRWRLREFKNKKLYGPTGKSPAMQAIDTLAWELIGRAALQMFSTTDPNKYVDSKSGITMVNFSKK